MLRTIHRGRTTALLLGLFAMTTVAGCGGSGSTGGTSNSAAPTLRIGLVNDEGGALSLPEFRIGAQAAVTYINSHGGVNGRQIKLTTCLADGSPEGSINCANKLIDAKVAIAYTGIDVASDAALPLYKKAGIPYVTSNAWGTAQLNDDDSFILHSTTDAYYAGPLQTLKNLGAHNVVLVSEKSASSQEQEQKLVQPISARLGLHTTAVYVDASSPDWTQAVTTALGYKPDGIVAELSEPDCVGLVTALNAADYRDPVMAGSCSVYIKALGDKAVGTYTFIDLYQPDTKQFAPLQIQKNLAIYESAMQAAGADKYLVGFAVAPFSAMFELRSILEQIPAGETIDGAKVRAAFAAAKTSPGFLGSDLHCGSHPYALEKSVCRIDLLVFKVVKTASGSVGKQPVGGGFQDFLTS